MKGIDFIENYIMCKCIKYDYELNVSYIEIC